MAGPTRPTVPDTFRKLVALLEREKVPFVVVGGIAAGLQGEPRYTEDVDVMAVIRSSRVPELAEAAKKDGFDIEPELAETQWLASGFVRLWWGPEGHQRAADLMACNSEFLRQVAWRAQAARFCGIKVSLASPEDMIIFKLSAYRLKDLPDLQSVFRRHRDRLDLEYLRKWVTWFAGKNPVFAEMPSRLEALLGGGPLPPAKHFPV